MSRITEITLDGETYYVAADDIFERDLAHGAKVVEDGLSPEEVSARLDADGEEPHVYESFGDLPEDLIRKHYEADEIY